MLGNHRSDMDSWFHPHPSLGDEVNENIVRSEIEGGVDLNELTVGATLELKTANRTYLLKNLGQGRMRIQGHPKYCPRPVTVEVHGSTWRNSMIKMHYIGRGMFLEFRHPELGLMRTSRIEEIREVSGGCPSPLPLAS